jgi:L-threonylcarbamoyladenylate synthase
MKTALTDDPNEAAALVRRGKLVAFPTETVFGLGADALNAEAVRGIFATKERPADNPLIVHLARVNQIESVAARLPPAARRLAKRFMPGPLTLILPRRAEVPDATTAGLSTVGVRVPRHPTASTFLDACNVPVAAPSANVSGRPSPTTWQAVQRDLDGRIAAILHGEPVEVGLESTVVDATGERSVVLRAGAVSLEALREVAPDVQLADDADDNEAPRSPGTKHRHYAPRAEVRLVDHPDDAATGPGAAFIGLDVPTNKAAFGRVAVCDDVGVYAQRLFRFFRACDAEGLRVVFCQRVPPAGLGRALMDRIRRAAAG